MEAEATRQATRGATRRFPDLWQVKAGQDGRLLKARPRTVQGAAALAARQEALTAWREIAAALAASGSPEDQRLGRTVETFSAGMVERQQPMTTRPQETVQPAPEPAPAR